MEFLEGGAVAERAARLLRDAKAAKLAIAYWGRGGTKLLGLDPKNRDVRVICCLNGGKSDPDEIGRFGARARQNDRLHAKVIWTPEGAIVGSANASSNGLPSEEEAAKGLIEAGVHISDPATLASIAAWFDRQYAAARRIVPADLDAAADARRRAIWLSGKRPRKPSLMEAFRSGWPEEFRGKRVRVSLWTTDATPAQNRAAERYIRDEAAVLRDKLHLEPKDFKRLGWYVECSPELPKDTVLIDGFYKRGRLRDVGICKTLELARPVPIEVGGETLRYTFVLLRGFDGFDYSITEADRRCIERASRELWRAASGDATAKLLPLSRAVPILLKHAALGRGRRPAAKPRTRSSARTASVRA